MSGINRSALGKKQKTKKKNFDVLTTAVVVLSSHLSSTTGLVSIPVTYLFPTRGLYL